MTSVHDLSSAPWPNLTAKRCLALTGGGLRLADEMLRRGAATVAEADTDPSAWVPMDPFDVVISVDLLSTAKDPTSVCEAVRSLTDGLFVSIEPIDLVTTVIHRRRVQMSRAGPEGNWTFNGSMHRRLLVEGGFRVERTSPPFVPVANEFPAPWLHRIVGRFLTGTVGTPYRGILARPPVCGP